LETSYSLVRIIYTDYSERRTTIGGREMNVLVDAEALSSYEKGFKHAASINSTTQVVGEVVILVGAFLLVRKGYRAMIKRAVRKELKRIEN
jgi:hypothetical protein